MISYNVHVTFGDSTSMDFPYQATDAMNAVWKFEGDAVAQAAISGKTITNVSVTPV